jgi:ATP-binding cassette subfamily B protein
MSIPGDHSTDREGEVGLPATVAGFFMRYVRRRPWHMAALAIVIILAAGCAVAVQYGMKLLVDAMAGDASSHADVWTALMLFLGLITAENVLWRVGGIIGCRTIVATGLDIRIDLFDYLSGHSMRYFADARAGALGNRVTATAGAFGAVAGTMIWNVTPPCIDFIGGVIIFASVSSYMALALVAFVIVVGLGIGFMTLRGRERHRAYAEAANFAGGELIDTIANMWAVKAFSARGLERRRLAREFGVEAAAQRRSWIYLEKTRAVHDLALCIMAGAMLFWALELWSSQRITPGDVVVVSALTFRILHGSRDLAFALIGMIQHVGFIGETLRVIGERHDIIDRPGARSFKPGAGAIELKDVCFHYPGRGDVLKHLSLEIPPGQKVGIVGASGAGKSTLINLIQRLEDAQEGEILIDGQRVTEVTQDSLRASIGVVPQEIALFHRTVGENIRFARPEADDHAVRAAADAADCEAFIADLPSSYDTLVGERGAKLSGGQRQRIGIARAFLKEAPIILLDEATSALDTEAEIEVQRGLDRLMEGRTVIAVAHRLSTLMSFDRIVVIEGGRIVEDGSPQLLLQRRGAFEAMWRLQAHEYTTPPSPPRQAQRH